MVYRIYVERKEGFANEAQRLLSDVRSFLRIDGIEKIRLINIYDVEGIDKEMFDKCINTVFSEPQTDNTYTSLPNDTNSFFIYEALAGQFDQRADSAEQCIQLLSQKERPIVKYARAVLLYGKISENDLEKIKKYVINPIESRLTDNKLPETLKAVYELAGMPETINGFCDYTNEDIKEFIKKYALSMDEADAKCCVDYFKSEKRDPTLTEIRVLDTYWSDHCRHTTFNTVIKDVVTDSDIIKNAFERYKTLNLEMKRDKPVTLMDITTCAVRYLKYKGILKNLDESDEINACTVKIDVDVEGKKEKWLLLFKNETHNHPTEIEPFGGAATCIGGAIRDPLSGRGYVYQAMRVTGAANPLTPVEDTIKGKLPQRKLVCSASEGYSSYGNQIGLSTGLVNEIYHPGYAAKHMEIGMVLGAAPEYNVVREVPEKGDVIILLGGKTGRDGCGGATGSSKSHNVNSLSVCGSEVQKGNAPEERKLQRLFRCSEATRLIKRCNDFGAGGVSVAIGELSDSLEIDLNAVPKKYEGLDATELAISESQERMAVVVSKQNESAFKKLAAKENLQATTVAFVSDSGRLRMKYNGVNVVDISREFLSSNGAAKYICVNASSSDIPTSGFKFTNEDFISKLKTVVSDLNVCSKRGLCERFDSTIGSSSILMPFGGIYQLSPQQVMAAKIPVLYKNTTSSTVASYGYNPFISEVSPYHGAYLAVVESIAKNVAAGADIKDTYLTFQEYFEKLGQDENKWGKPFASILGALSAQLDFNVAAIGGKDSMSGTFENMSVPPTLVSFGVSTARSENIISCEFKKADSTVVFIAPKYLKNGLPDKESQINVFDTISSLIKDKKIISAYTPTYGGVCEAIVKMCIGNKLGFKFDDSVNEHDIFDYRYGSFIIELNKGECIPEGFTPLGITQKEYSICYKNDCADLSDIYALYENKLESVYPSNIACEDKTPYISSFTTDKHIRASEKSIKPRVLIPVFPGTNCEYDSANAFIKAGAEVTVLPIRNLSTSDIQASADEFAKKLSDSQILFLPGGFSAGDEPDGSAKFITCFLRSPAILKQISDITDKRDGLIGGICNGFQALVKLGLLPYGSLRDLNETDPTLTFNPIGRHQSKLVRTKVISDMSPWRMYSKVNDVYTVAVSHGEGRFVISDSLVKQLELKGQITTQYVSNDGMPSMDIAVNPNASYMAIEGITSPDGRIMGKMGHSERINEGVYINVDGNKYDPIFKGAVDYFK